MLDVLNGIYMGNTLKIPCISRFLVFSPKSKIGGSPVDVFTVYYRVFWMYLQFRRCINIQYIKIHLIHRACKFRMYWQDLDVLCLYWGCIRCIRFIKFVFDVYCVCILDVLEFRLFMVIPGILTGLKLGLPSWFINQPSCSGPEGPRPHLEGAAGRDRTHVTPDEGCRSAN